MSRFPLRYAHQNILVGEGDARAALFRVDTVSYPFLAAADKREWLRRLARFAFAVEADFSLYRVCRAYPAEGYAEQAMALLDDRGQSPAAYRSYLNGHEAHLRELRSFTPEVYLAVSLPAPRTMSGLDRMRRRVEGLFGVEHPVPIPASEIDALVAAEERAFRRAEASLPVRRATTRELQWLLRRAACRGVAEPALDDHWEPAALIVETADGQPRLRAAGHRPRAPRQRAGARAGPRAWSSTPRRAARIRRCSGWARCPRSPSSPAAPSCCSRRLRRLPFPVDAVVHARWLGNREAITRVRRRIVDADVAFSEQLNSTHGPLSYAAEENRQLARELDAYLQSHERPPLLNARDLARRRRALARASSRQRVEALVHRFGTIALHRPLGLQPALFLDHLPRADGGTVRDYADVLTIEQFGALMPVGTHQAGSDRGVYIGRTLAGGARPVRFDVTEASRTGPAAVDPARRHARLGQDDRRRAARLPGRAPRLARRRRRPQARPQPRRAARARRPRARDRALRRRPLPRPARPARRRTRVAARGPRQLLPDRAAAAVAAGVGDAGPQGRPPRAGVLVAELPRRARAAARLRRSRRPRRRRSALGLGRLRRRPARLRRRRTRPRRGASGR